MYGQIHIKQLHVNYRIHGETSQTTKHDVQQMHVTKYNHQELKAVKVKHKHNLYQSATIILNSHVRLPKPGKEQHGTMRFTIKET